MGNSYVNRDRNLSTQKPVSQFQPGEKYHDDSGFMPSNARRWLDIIEWCDEATQLSILVSDSHLKNGKGEGQSINPKQSTLYAKFIPFVSRDLVSLLLCKFMVNVVNDIFFGKNEVSYRSINLLPFIQQLTSQHFFSHQQEVLR